MLKKGSLILICTLFLFACDSNQKEQKKVYKSLVSKTEITEIYSIASDSIKSWLDNGLLIDTAYEEKIKFIYLFKLDSTICINSNKTKMIGTLLHFGGLQTKYFTDGLEEFYGAKIKGKWYFWTGGYTPVIRSAFKCHDPKKPLSYKQLHSHVGNGGYLDKNGNIRNQWFEAKFKGPGWGFFKERYIYKSILDGNRIDNEKEYWEYLWKRAGIINWITKVTNDSIVLYNKQNKIQLTDEQQWEIGYYISSKMVNSEN